MKPYVDRGFALLTNPAVVEVSAPTDETIAFDAYRQGVEVTNIKYFLRSNLPYMSSTGLPRGSASSLIGHELDFTNLGQGMNLDGFSPHHDDSDNKTAKQILENNIVQSDTDSYFGRQSQDGQIDVFSDTGKRSLLPDRKIIKSKGISASVVSYGKLYSLAGVTRDYFLDAADVFLGVSAPGYGGSDVSFSPFIDKISLNSFGDEVEYSYVSPDNKSPATGNDYYGSVSGTDSISYGGFLR